MALMQPGTRVIRGPDWQSRRQDGGEGHAGTIVYVPKEGSSDLNVTVIWDSGRELRYRAGKDSKYDLRMLDNAQTGVVHEHITCDSCSEDPIRGMRWKCLDCEDYDLCTTCYMAGKHDVTHGFLRIDTATAKACAVSPRSHSVTKTISGIYKGAKVMRGPHWKWKNDDGGEGEDGRVVEIFNWKMSGYRAGVKVKWKATKKETLCRLGGEGCVDVIYEEEATLGKYFIHHLPLVDVQNPGEINLKCSDKVRVALNEKHFRRLQDNQAYGGWNDGMKQCIQEKGTIVRILLGGKTIRLQYEDGKVWTVNRQAITRIYSFSTGDAVKILEDVNSVRELQEGHGGWNDEMMPTLGKFGRVVRIDEDGDFRVKVEDRTWIYSPVCCSPVEDPAVAGNIPDLTKSEMELDQLDDMMRMRADVNRVAEVLADLFVDLLRAVPDGQTGEAPLVEAAAKGDIDRVKEFVRKHPDKVNATHEHKTALQLAAYEGKEEVVKYLLDHKADLHLKDNEGDTALHFAAFGEEHGTMKILLDRGADIDCQNKAGQTCLHVTVGKASIECTKLLTTRGASPNIQDKDGDSPMHDSIIQKKRQSLLVSYLLKSPNADYTVVNARGFNVLQWAALKDCRSASEIIIQKNKDVIDAKMKEGFTAMHISAANDHLEIASSLLMAGANKDARDDQGRSPLIIAVSQSHKRMVELLLTWGCDVNLQDTEGNTALHVAQISRALPDQMARLLGVPVKNDDIGIQITCMLVESRANLELKNKNGKTALDLCSDEATKEFIIRLHKQAMSNSLKTTQRGVILPTHWDAMPRETPVTRVTLDSSKGLQQKEYQEVRNKFCKTLQQARIHKIDRVQNKFLWEHYSLKRRQMEHEYGKGHINEMDLYHGTHPETVDSIVKDNLDHRLAGDRVGSLFGKGTYFAMDAKHSDGYSEPDTDRRKYMFQCRVLAGKWTTGDQKYKRPPPINPDDKKSKLYDSCVDNVDKPKIFCVFDVNQYYPEYVIEYE